MICWWWWCWHWPNTVCVVRWQKYDLTAMNLIHFVDFVDRFTDYESQICHTHSPNSNIFFHLNWMNVQCIKAFSNHSIDRCVWVRGNHDSFELNQWQLISPFHCWLNYKMQEFRKLLSNLVRRESNSEMNRHAAQCTTSVCVCFILHVCIECSLKFVMSKYARQFIHFEVRIVWIGIEHIWCIQKSDLFMWWLLHFNTAKMVQPQADRHCHAADMLNFLHRQPASQRASERMKKRVRWISLEIKHLFESFCRLSMNYGCITFSLYVKNP